MRSLEVIESFNIFKNRKVQFLQGVISSLVNFFLFKMLEEAFTASIIERVALCEGSILRSMIKMDIKPKDTFHLS